MRPFKFLFFLSLILVISSNLVLAQTFLYKRVMIVKNGAKTSMNDDAHYITFTDKGCYESDKDGFTSNNGFVKFTKNENNLHCYYGNCSFGTAHYYFSDDYSRLNIALENNTTYVYQRELSGNTTASRRTTRNSNNGGVTVIVPPVITIDNGTYSGSNSTGSSSSRSSAYTKCRSCNGTGLCTRCNGRRGDWRDTGYYTGSNTKTWINCSSCNGTGRCPICHGTGRL